MKGNKMTYTAEMTAALVAEFVAGNTPVEVLAEKFGKSVRSVVAKLSREGVYVAKATSTKVKGPTKADLVAKLAERYGVDPTVLASLEKATKEALEVLVAE